MEYLEREKRVQEAVEFKRQYLKSSFKWLAKQFNCDKDAINRRFKGKDSKLTRRPTNTKLSPNQDKALYRYLTTLYELGIPLFNKRIASAANEILTASGRDTTVGEN